MRKAPDPRYPAVSLPAGGLEPSHRRPRPALPFPLDGGSGEIHLLSTRPVDHVLRFGELFRIAEEVRRRSPGSAIHAWLHSDLADASPFALLPVDSVERMPGAADAAGCELLLDRLARPGAACVLLGTGRPWESRLRARSGIRFLGRVPLGWRVPAAESPQAGAAGRAFLEALQRESPRWSPAGAPRAAIGGGGDPRFLVHQARFHVGDALWLTPLLREIRRFAPGARTTVVAPPAALPLLAGDPHVGEVVPYAPQSDAAAEEAARRRVLKTLSGRRFDVALSAFARRPESRWLAQALAGAGVPVRINLEYFDPALDSRRTPPWLTHEGWFFWGCLPSPRLLLHALDPLCGPGRVRSDEDRRIGLHLPEEAGARADERLAACGIDEEPFAVLAPGGFSSARWPAERFARLAACLAGELGLHVLIEGSPAEEPLLAEVAARAGGGAGRRIVAAADPLDVFAALLARARLLVANDSAPIHLAEAAGTPTVYFAQREKLLHSHPAGGACWAVFDEVDNDVRRISTGQALGAVRGVLGLANPAIPR